MSLNQWRRAMREVVADPRFAPEFSFLLDCRPATLAPSIANVRGVVDFLTRNAALVGRGRWAVVVERPAGFGMARMAATLADAEGLRLAAFQNVEEARRWLMA
jgi:hypothetical protein